MAHSVRRHLGLAVAEYDEAIRRFIPGYETMLAVVAEAVASVTARHVVELGAGTGALSECLLQAGAERVDLIDIDPEMLALAGTRLARFGNRALPFERSFEGALDACDAVASSLALHHMASRDDKARLFAEVFAAVRPGGLFVNGDAFMPAGEPARAPLFEFWVEHMVERGIAAERAREHLAEWGLEDHYQPLESEMESLRRVGFDTDCVWERGPIAVVVARRPRESSAVACRPPGLEAPRT